MTTVELVVICLAVIFIVSFANYCFALTATDQERQTIHCKIDHIKNSVKRKLFLPKPPAPQLMSADIPELRNELFISILEVLSGVNSYYYRYAYRSGVDNIFYYGVNHLEYGQRYLLKKYIVDNYCSDKNKAVTDVYWSKDLSGGRKNKPEDKITPQEADILCIKLW